MAQLPQSAAEPSGMYNRGFFDDQMAGSYRSAQVIVDILLKILRVQSVVDIGCGVGTWLRAFEERGVTDLAGYDGEYVDRGQLLIEPARFHPADLALPVDFDRRFDLAVCLEVGEHLPLTASDTLVGSLVRAAPAVLFSAAIPGQGGTHHVNEQWPSFWRARFRANGYHAFDLIRPQVAYNLAIDSWYRHNTMLYLAKDHPAAARLRPNRWPSLKLHGRHILLVNYIPLRKLVRGLFSRRIEAKL